MTAVFHATPGRGTLYVKVFSPTASSVRQSGTTFSALSGVSESQYATGLITATEDQTSDSKGTGIYRWTPPAFAIGHYPCKAYSSAAPSLAAFPEAEFYLDLPTLDDIMRADIYIDTSVTPWAMVWMASGSGAIGVGTELLRKRLRDVDAASIGDVDTVIGQLFA